LKCNSRQPQNLFLKCGLSMTACTIFALYAKGT
jgi:hypothetical protein